MRTAGQTRLLTLHSLLSSRWKESPKIFELQLVWEVVSIAGSMLRNNCSHTSCAWYPLKQLNV
jgi:hypothetical protein